MAPGGQNEKLLSRLSQPILHAHHQVGTPPSVSTKLLLLLFEAPQSELLGTGECSALPSTHRHCPAIGSLIQPHRFGPSSASPLPLPKGWDLTVSHLDDHSSLHVLPSNPLPPVVVLKGRWCRHLTERLPGLPTASQVESAYSLEPLPSLPSLWPVPSSRLCSGRAHPCAHPRSRCASLSSCLPHPWSSIFHLLDWLSPSSELTLHVPSPLSELTELFIRFPEVSKGQKLPCLMKRSLLPPEC